MGVSAKGDEKWPVGMTVEGAMSGSWLGVAGKEQRQPGEMGVGIQKW